MTMEEFYSRMGGDYAEVLRRVGNESRITKVLGMLPRDENMASLCAALQQEDYETAFRAAHTLKGITMSLGLSRLAQANIELTETLRPGKASEKIGPQFASVQQCYAEAIEAISELLNEPGKEGGENAPAK